MMHKYNEKFKKYAKTDHSVPAIINDSFFQWISIIL